MRRTRWSNQRIIAFCFLLLIFASFNLFVFSEEIDIKNEIDSNPVVLSNAWVRAEIDAASGGYIHQYTANGGSFFRPIDKIDSIAQRNAGNAFVLFTNHPLKGLNTIPLPEQYRCDLTRGASETVLKIESKKPTAVSVKKEYRMNDWESVFNVSTTITNTGDSSLAFYPSEISKYDAAVGKNRLPNLQAYLYSPYTSRKKEKSGFELIRGENDKSQFNQMPDECIFITRYMVKKGEVKLTNKKNWIVFQNLVGDNIVNGGTACAVEYGFPNKKPVPVEDNLIVCVNGAEPLNPQKGGTVQLDPFIRATYVLGKVVLEPGQSFTYTARWTATNCDGPIIDVRNGLLYNKHLEVFVDPDLGTFVTMADIGVPQEGKIGFQLYNKEGDVYKIETSSGDTIEHMHIMSIAYDLRPKEITPFLPTYILHGTQIFTPGNLRSPEDTFLKLIEDKAHIVRMILVKKDRSKIRFLDEAVGPFKIYDKSYR